MKSDAGEGMPAAGVAIVENDAAPEEARRNRLLVQVADEDAAPHQLIEDHLFLRVRHREIPFVGKWEEAEEKSAKVLRVIREAYFPYTTGSRNITEDFARRPTAMADFCLISKLILK